MTILYVQQSCWAAMPALNILSMRRCPAERGGVGQEVTLVIGELAAMRSTVCCVLLGKRNWVVTTSAGSEWQGKGVALVAVLLRIHEERVAGVQRGEVVKIASFLCRGY
jgi:hypothetical protein